MALFTDGSISTLDDLRAYESAVFDVSSTERIELTKKLSLAQQELETELNAALRQQANPPELSQVVVTRPLRQWHTFHTLSLLYRDAYNSHFNDRYLGKWKEYDRLAKWAGRKLLETGIGVVQIPLPKAGSPSIGAAPGNLPAGTYWVRISWTNAAGEEGCPSDPGNLTVPDGSLLVVEPKTPPGNACGWNVYVGTSPEDTQRQNDQPINLGTIWETTDSGLQNGAVAGEGQTADYFLVQRQVLQRG